jgi:hypothetical protein
MSSSYPEDMVEIMKLRTPEEGKKWLSKKLRRLRRGKGEDNGWRKKPYKEAKALLLSNYGYFAGYYGTKEMNHVRKILGACHPVFG